MNESVSAIRIRALPLRAANAVESPNLSQRPEASGGKQFSDLLNRAIENQRPVKFSAHAQSRLSGRGIEFTEADRSRLEEGAERAGAKGSRDALLVMDGKGFILNVKSRTVLTALDVSEMNNRIVTNIDSTVFL